MTHLREELDGPKPFRIAGNLFLCQAGKAVTVRRGGAQEEGAGDHIIDLPGVQPECPIEWQAQQFPLLMAVMVTGFS